MCFSLNIEYLWAYIVKRAVRRNIPAKVLCCVSIHTGLTECERTDLTSVQIAQFQSTHSLRSVTSSGHGYRLGTKKISIHTLLTECDVYDGSSGLSVAISIHTLLTECDALHFLPSSFSTIFQSTHSLRSVTSSIFSSSSDR